jgi:hypothetical protein
LAKLRSENMAKVVEIGSIKLELTMEEAKALSDISGHGIIGSSKSRAKCFSEIYYALQRAGIKGDNWPHRPTDLKAGVPLEFTE